MSAVVSLRAARKRAARDAARKAATENAARHGVAKAERRCAPRPSATKAAAHLDGHRRDDRRSEALGRPVKRSLTLRGHRTSVSLEEEFWRAFREIAAASGRPINELAAEIDEARGVEAGLASAIRVHVLGAGTARCEAPARADGRRGALRANRRARRILSTAADRPVVFAML